MEMIKNNFGRRCLLAVAIFLGMNTCQAAEPGSNNLNSDTVTDNIADAGKNSAADNGKSGRVTDNKSGSKEISNRSIKDSNDNTANTNAASADATNANSRTGAEPKSTSLNVQGSTDGAGNQVTVPKGADIQSAGNAVEFNSDADIFDNENRDKSVKESIKDLDISGKIHGDNNAIYIGRNSFVKNINVNRGAKIEGDISSDWKHLSDGDKIQYNGKQYSAAEYNSDLVTNLNFNTSMVYGGKISGADNIKINIKKGTLKFTGTADVVGVEIMSGAKLYGGTIKVNDFGQEGTGKVVSHGTIAASSANTNLVIDGDLVSDGVLQRVSGGTAGKIIVNGDADIDGSIVTTDSLLPNETETVLVANSVSGRIKNNANNPFPISATLNATGKVVKNTVVVTTHKADNMPDMDSKESETLNAMNSMFENLDGNSQQEEMREFYNLEPSEAKQTLKEIGSNDSAQILSVVQQSTAVDKMISGRITKVFATDSFTPDNFASNYINVNISPMNFAEGENNSPEMKIKVKVPSRQENNFWINYMKNWGSLKGGTDYHGSAIVGGYDRPIGKKWRAGIFATYGTIGYGADSSRATVYDTRLGFYAGYHNRASDVYFYINGGQLRNSLHRGISSLGLSTNAKYKSRIIEIGGEYKYDLHARDKKIWHVSPFINLQASYLKQSSYSESGAGVYNQHVESNSNTYFAVQTGVDFKRYYRSGMFGFRLGVKRGFTGADPDLKISYEGDPSSSYRIRHDRDKTHFICAVRGESEFARGWFMGGEAELQLGENDKDVTASIMLRRMW